MKAVVFDMDGVIFDSEKLYRKHWMITGKKWGIPEDEMRKLCNLIAGATKEVNRKLMQSRYGADFDYDLFRKETMDRMDEEIRREGLTVKPGVTELFSWLKDQGLRIALATSTMRERAEGNLIKAGLLPWFDAVIYGGMVENGKPAPDIYLKACEELGVDPQEAIGIEDSINGVKSSHAAGLYTIMVVDLIEPTEETRQLANATYDSLYEVLRWLEEGGRTGCSRQE